jgi:hypothetical protein
VWLPRSLGFPAPHTWTCITRLSSIHITHLYPPCLAYHPCFTASVVAEAYSLPHTYTLHSPYSTSSMAAIVAPQHTSLWQAQAEQVLHVPSMHMSGVLSTYDTSRTVTNPATSSTPFRTVHAQMDMAVPHFPNHSLSTAVPYQSGSFAFDTMSVNPYNLQQHFAVTYPSTAPSSVAYHGATGVPPLPTLRGTRGGFTVGGTSPPSMPVIKAEASSPVQQSQLYSDVVNNSDYQRTNSDTGVGNNSNFSTHVDTLMKAIQSKQKPIPNQHQPISQVCTLGYQERTAAGGSRRSQEDEDEVKRSHRPRKKYQCTMTGCDKRFYQKTHLAIHIRSHTGDKPFVSLHDPSIATPNSGDSSANTPTVVNDSRSWEISRCVEVSLEYQHDSD